MATTILLATVLIVSSVVLFISTIRVARRVQRLARTSIKVRVGDRDYEYTHGMTPDDFVQVLAKDFNERPTNGRRKEAIRS